MLGAASRWWFHSRCVLCGEPGMDPARDLCAACHAALPWQHAACARCALPLPAEALRCGSCLKRAPMFDAALAAWRYEEPIASLITRFKYGGDLAAGRVLALGLAERAEPVERPQALVPVPLHWRRLRERGFDQALEIARVLSRSLERPVLELIERRRATAAQAALSAAERRRNLRAAFAPIRGAVVPVHVALIDDVMTTGSTLDAAARVLRAAGAQRIDAWVLARAE